MLKSKNHHKNKTMKKLTYLFIATLVTSFLISSCSENCTRITKKNLDGTWLVNQLSIDGENQEIGNLSLTFGKDGTYSSVGQEGTWEFGSTNDAILVQTEDESFEFQINEFSKTEMLITKSINDRMEEYSLVKE